MHEYRIHIDDLYAKIWLCTQMGAIPPDEMSMMHPLITQICYNELITRVHRILELACNICSCKVHDPAYDPADCPNIKLFVKSTLSPDICHVLMRKCSGIRRIGDTCVYYLVYICQDRMHGFNVTISEKDGETLITIT